jgi:lysophospholipase L1-like esterase
MAPSKVLARLSQARLLRWRTEAPAWAWIVIVMAVVAFAVMTPFALRRETPRADQVARAIAAAESAAAAADASAAAAAARVDIAVLGDSFTSGSPMDSGPQARWPALLTSQYPWDVTAYATDGTGFVNQNGYPNTTFGWRVDRVMAAMPDVVVVAGGHDDADQSVAEVRTAAEDVVTRLRDGLPNAKLIVIGALWPGPPPASVTAINDALREVATDAGTTFVDPLAEGWLNDPGELIGQDGTHPTDAGHQALARRIGDALIAAGVRTTV